MAIGYCPEPKEIIYHAVNYSNLVAVQGLMRHYYQLKEENIYKPNFELIAILTDIAVAIKNTELTDKQKDTLELYMMGWTLEEIGEKLGVSHQRISESIVNICRRLSLTLVGGNNGKSK